EDRDDHGKQPETREGTERGRPPAAHGRDREHDREGLHDLHERAQEGGRDGRGGGGPGQHGVWSAHFHGFRYAGLPKNQTKFFFIGPKRNGGLAAAVYTKIAVL